MDTINKILILGIILLLINYLTDGRIFDPIQNFLNSFKDQVDNFMGLTYTNRRGVYPTYPHVPYARQLDFPYHNHNNPDELDEESYNIYRFINNLVTPNVNIYELTANRGEKLFASEDLEDEIFQHISKIFNSSGYKFENIKFLNKIAYYENPRGKDIEPIEFRANVSYLGNPIGTVKIRIDTFLREDKFFYKPSKSGFLTILNAILLDRTYIGSNREKVWRSAYILNQLKRPQGMESTSLQSKLLEKPIEPSKSQQKAQIENNKLQNKMIESFNETFVSRENYEDLFIKPPTGPETNQNEGFKNDTDYSLIPSMVDMSVAEN